MTSSDRREVLRTARPVAPVGDLVHLRAGLELDLARPAGAEVDELQSVGADAEAVERLGGDGDRRPRAAETRTQAHRAINDEDDFVLRVGMNALLRIGLAWFFLHRREGVLMQPDL